MDSMEPFAAVGERIDAAWRQQEYRLAAFPDISTTVLAEARLHTHVSPSQVLTWLLGADALPAQEDPDAIFGQPPITLFRTDRFFIAALFWVDGTTTVHQHSFSGALQVLSGSSIHAEYDFESDALAAARRGAEAASASAASAGDGATGETRLVLGDVGLRTIELLRYGDVRPIRAGRAFIHSLFHLDRPSLSMVVRTYVEPEALPQYDYFAPHVCYSGQRKPQLLRRKLQGLRLLQSTGAEEYERCAAELLAHSDLETGFLVLDSAVEGVMPRHTIDVLRDALRARHGAAADAVLAVVDEQQRVRQLVDKRGRVADADQRFLLALLLHAIGRGDILSLTAARVPGVDPRDTVARWVGALSQVPLIGQAPLGGGGGGPALAWVPNILGCPHPGEPAALVLRRMLGERAGEAPSAADGGGIAALNERMVRELRQYYEHTPLFRTLLRR